jgi:manganese transport protein
MSKFGQRLKNIGPGALVAAAFIGPGTVTTCTVSGTSYGYTMLWAMLFATIATIIFQEMAARIGIATQKGLGENVREGIQHPVLKWIAIILIIVAIFIGNVAYETGNITGSVLGIQAVAPSSSRIALIVLVAVCAFALLIIGNYNVVEKVLTAIVVLMGVVFIVTAVASKADWPALIHGLFVPKLPANDMSGILVAIGLIGTTVVPYNLFLHASSAAERWKDPEQIGDARFDAILSIGLGGIISMCIIIAAAANLYPYLTTGAGGVKSIINGDTTLVANISKMTGADMAKSLTPLLGSWAGWFIAIGLLAAGFTSTITAPLAAAYAVSGSLGWGSNMKSARFRAIWIIVMVCGALMAVALGSSPAQLILVAQAANAIILPIMAFFVLYCANKKSMGKLRNHAFANVAGVVIIGVTLFICYRNMTSFVASVQKLIGG